jgi:hypothetical protein
MRRYSISILFFFLLAIFIFGITVGAAAASTTYDFLRGQMWAAPRESPVELGIFTITIDPLVAGENASLLTLPQDYKLVQPGDIAAIQDPSVILITKKISDNELLVSVNSGDMDGKVTFLVPIKTTIPRGANGDIELVITNVEGQFPAGRVIAGAALPGEITIESSRVGAIKDGKSSVQIAFSENMAQLLSKSSRIKLTLPDGFTWANAKITPVSGEGLDIRPVTAGRVLELRTERESTQRSSFRVDAEIGVSNAEKAREGEVRAEIEGLRSLSSPTILVAHYEAPEPAQPEPIEPRAVFIVGSASYKHNNRVMAMDVAPYLRDGRVFLPLRYVGVSLDVDEINWDGQTATLVKDGVRVQVAAGSKRIVVNGQALTMDAAPELAPPGRIMLPYRYLAEAFEATVAWNQADRSVAIMLN